MTAHSYCLGWTTLWLAAGGVDAGRLSKVDLFFGLIVLPCSEFLGRSMGAVQYSGVFAASDLAVLAREVKCLGT